MMYSSKTVIKKILYSYFYVSLIIIIVFISVLTYLSSHSFDNYRFFSVRSGSMQPSLRVGDLILTKRSNKYKSTDIITVRREFDVPLTHRIVDSYTTSDGEIIFVTKGDQNSISDPDLVNSSEVIGKVIWKAPLIGTLVEYLKSDTGLGLFIFTPIAFIIFTELARIKKELKKNREKITI